MSVAELTPPKPPAADGLANGSPHDDQRIVLSGVPWQSYEKMLEAVGERRVFLTYDRGRLEIMAPAWNHEWWKSRTGFLICVLGHELKMRVQPGGSTTFRREDLARGLEPDDCFYIQNAERMLGPRQIDLTRDPPPDLALEIEMTRSALDRMGIYAALRIPEVWRFDGVELQIHRLRLDGQYEISEQSLAFPSLPVREFVQFLNDTQMLDQAELIDPFRAWVKQHVRSESTGSGGGHS